MRDGGEGSRALVDGRESEAGGFVVEDSEVEDKVSIRGVSRWWSS